MEMKGYKRKECFTTPDGYFKQLNLEIEEATCKTGVTPPKKRSLVKRAATVMGYAAMLAIVAAFSTVIFRRIIAESSMTANADISYDSEFIERMLTDYPIDEYTFYCYLTGCE